MRPVKIRIKNLGLTSGEFDLSDITLITGRNRSGKTTLLKALRLGITGTVYDPDQDRNLTFDELTPPGVNELGIFTWFDNGFWIDREFIKSTKGDVVKIETRLDFDGITQSAVGKSRLAEKELAQALRCSRFGLHLDLIIEAKTTERRKILLGMLVGSDDSRPLLEWIFEKSIELGQITETEQPALETYLKSVVSGINKELMILDRLHRINTKAGDDWKKAQSDLDNATTLIKDLGFEGAETVDTSQIPVVEETLSNTETDIEELSQHIGSVKADKGRSDTLHQEISLLETQEKELGELRSREDAENDQEGITAEMDEKVEAKQNEYQRILDEMKAVHESKFTDLDKYIIGLIEQSSKIQGTIDAKRAESARLDTSTKKIIDKIAALEEHVSTESDKSNCPLCTSVIDPEKLIKIWNDEINTAAATKKSLHVDIGILKNDRDAFDNKKSGLETEKTNLKTDHTQSITSIENDTDKAVEKIKTKYQEQFKNLDAQLKSIDKSEALAQYRIGKESELNKIQLVEIEPIEENLELKKKDKERLQIQLDKLKLAEANAKKKATLETAQFGLMLKVKCLSGIKKASGEKGIQGILLEEKIIPFIDSVNKVLHRFAPDMEFTMKFQDDRGKESCQFGFISDGVDTLFESASGVEKALILFAIVIALMNKERFVNLKPIFMDEIANCDHKFVPILIDAAQIAIGDNLLDCAFLAGPLRDSDLESILEKSPEIIDSMIECKRK